MSGIILGFFTFVLVLVCGYIALIVLMQRASSNAGLGASLGGGAAESALGGGASNVLVRGTIIGAILFFVLSFGLYLGHMANYEAGLAQGDSTLPGVNALPQIESDKPALPSLEEAPESTEGTGVSNIEVTNPPSLPGLGNATVTSDNAESVSTETPSAETDGSSTEAPQGEETGQQANDATEATAPAGQ